jgi:hypothetical protein
MFAPLHEIIFFCVLFLFFFGVGRIFLSLLPDNLRSGVPSFYLLSVVGVAVVSMAAQCLYFGGLPIRTFAPFLFLVSCSGWGWHLVSAARRRRCGERRPVPDRRVFIRIAVLITGTLLVVLWFAGERPIGNRPLFFFGILMTLFGVHIFSLGIMAELFIHFQQKHEKPPVSLRVGFADEAG